MTSERQIAANRENAGRSTGPKTRRGKSRASRNAVRHGLAGANFSASTDRVEHLAKALCRGKPDPFLYEQAVIIAESHILLARIRAARIAAVERKRKLASTIQPQPLLPGLLTSDDRRKILDHLNRGDLQNVTNLLKRASYALCDATKAAASNACKVPQVDKAASEPSSSAKASGPIDFSQEGFDDFECVTRSLSELLSLERYERRALSRRKRAIRRFQALQEDWVP